MICTNCGKLTSDDSKRCEHCGLQVMSYLQCQRCGKQVEDDRVDCPYCGSVLKDPKVKGYSNMRYSKGKKISYTYIFFMILFTITGGWLGMFLSGRVVFYKRYGEYTYDEDSRKCAKIAFIFSVIMSVVSIILFGY